MKRWLFLGVFFGLLLAYPQLAAVATTLLGTAAIWAAAQPTLLAFAAGILARPHITRRWAA